MTTAARSTREVMDDHLALREAGDVETDIIRNYDRNAVCLSLTGVKRGHEGVRAMAHELAEALPASRYKYTKIVTADQIGYLVWDAESRDGMIRDAIDSFVVRDGRIVAHTVHYRVQRR